MTPVAAIAAAIALGASVLFTPEAGAVSARVRSACANDFMAHCSQHETRQCGRPFVHARARVEPFQGLPRCAHRRR